MEEKKILRNFLFFDHFCFIVVYFQRATIKSLIVTSDIKFRYAATRVSAEYTNPYNSPARADFHVTLPAQAYISNFSMWVFAFYFHPLKMSHWLIYFNGM